MNLVFQFLYDVLFELALRHKVGRFILGAIAAVFIVSLAYLYVTAA